MEQHTFSRSSSLSTSCWGPTAVQGCRIQTTQIGCRMPGLLGTSVKPHSTHSAPWNISAKVFFAAFIQKRSPFCRLQPNLQASCKKFTANFHMWPPLWFVLVLNTRLPVWECTSVHCNHQCHRPGAGSRWLAPQEDLEAWRCQGGHRVSVCSRRCEEIGPSWQGGRCRTKRFFYGVLRQKRLQTTQNIFSDFSHFYFWIQIISE